MDFTDAMYGISADSECATMCLGNLYPTGYHCIGKHSDDEKQMSDACKDVVCWVVGAARRLIIREKKHGKQLQDRIVLSVLIPQGVYIMHGNMFQSRYSHEIPREGVALFDKLCSIAPQDIPKLEQADWLAANPKAVKEQYRKLYEQYKDWSEPRASYTIRYFKK